MDNNLCRICLIEIGTISLFDKDDDVQYCTKIMKCVKVTIAKDDNYPKMICSTCVNELSVAYNFVNKCEVSDKTLRCIEVGVSVGDDFCDNLDSYIDLEFKDDEIKNELGQYEIKNEVENGEYILLGNLNIERNTPSKQIEAEIRSCDYLLNDVQDKEQDNSSSKEIKVRRGKCKKKRSKTGPMQCVMCGLLVISRSAMEAHMRTHTREKPYACSSCDARYPTNGALKRHISTYHSKRERKFTCEMCGNSFFTKNDIITHMRIHTDEKPYVCPYCSKAFRQVASLIRHKRVHSGEKPFPCQICGKRFSDKNLVKKHQLVHTDERKFSCHLCNKAVKSKTALNTHLNLHSNEKRNFCGFCGMAFSMKGNLQTHIKRVHSEKSGQCSVCVRTFSDLEEHMRRHTGERPYVCSECSQAFATKRSLAHHVVFKHENSSKFKCSIGDCVKTFPTAMMLEFHLLKQHTNHTPFICPHCARGFFRSSDLTRHLRVNHLDMHSKASKIES